MHIQALMNDEVSSMVTHMRKLMGSDHPVLRTLKRLIFHEGKNNLQVNCSTFVMKRSKQIWYFPSQK
jgi:hypothetical protein